MEEDRASSSSGTVVQVMLRGSHFLEVGIGRDSKSKQRVSCLKECFRREPIWVEVFFNFLPLPLHKAKTAEY